MQALSSPVPPKTITDAQPTVGNSAVQSLALFDQLYVGRPRRWLVFFLVAYLLTAFSYATTTPAWQSPDEPAHYNYIAHVAEYGSLPVLRQGDYDQSLLEVLLATQFAPKIPTSGLRYESYQPPLYYLTATPVFWVTNGSLLALRLYNVLLGAISLILLYHCVILVFPQKTMLAAGAVAFAASLPMQVAMTAALNNDGLATLLILASMLVLLRWMRDQFYGEVTLKDERQVRRLMILGLLLGLGLLTKIYAYMLLPIILVVVVLIGWLQPTIGRPVRLRSWQDLWRSIGMSLWTLIPALLLGLPLWLRNIWLYGRWDFLGLNWHDQVVFGQPRTVDWIADFGWVEYSERAFRFTFQSFWGVFGWMGVFMDNRIYLALLVFSGVIFAGLLWSVVRLISGPPDTEMDLFQVAVLTLLGTMLLAVVVSYVGYNFKFVQHQGRYLFWGLLPLSTVVALGWREVLHPLQGWITGLLASVLAAALTVTGIVNSTLDKWTVLIIGLIALLLMLQPLLLAGSDLPNIKWLPNWYRRFVRHHWVAGPVRVLRSLIWALPFLLLLLLNLLIPWLYIMPQLGV
jgi:4-amino-4-deoxy-L-arabinose transferase-like glycosyltransferase